MNTIYSYVLPKNLKMISGYILILISSASGFFFFPSIFDDMPLRSLFQLTGLFCLCMVVFIAARYISKNTLYSVVEEEEKLYFTVTEITNNGRKRTTVCKFCIENIEKISLFYSGSRSDADARKTFDGTVRKMQHFNFCPDMRSDPVCYIVVDENETRFLVKISPDDTLYKYLANGLDNDSAE